MTSTLDLMRQIEQKDASLPASSPDTLGLMDQIEREGSAADFPRPRPRPARRQRPPQVFPDMQAAQERLESFNRPPAAPMPGGIGDIPPPPTAPILPAPPGYEAIAPMIAARPPEASPPSGTLQQQPPPVPTVDTSGFDAAVEGIPQQSAREAAGGAQPLGEAMAHAVPRGAVETSATALSPFALGERMAVANIGGLMPQIQNAGRLDASAFDDLMRAIHNTPHLSPAQEAFLTLTARDVRTGKLAPEDVPAYLGQAEVTGAGRAQEAMRGFAAEQFPISPENEQRLPVQLGRAVGSTAGYVGSRMLFGPMGLALFAGASGSGEAIENAIAAGASDEEAAKAGLLGIAPGLTDMVPVERLLKPVAHIPGVRGALYSIARKAVEQGAIEGTQEAVQQFMQNAVSRLTHTPDQDLEAGIAENGLVGFLVGALFGGGAGGIQAAQGQPGPTAQDIDAAAAEADPNPTPGQKEAGNYKKAHVRAHGLDITIETPRGVERTGTGPDGEPWSNVSPAHYGYVKRTEGADGEHVDVYVGESPDAPEVYVVDQIDPDTGAFDEHKAIIGAASQDEATAIYDAGFSDGRGPERRGAVTAMPVDQFKTWLEGNTRKPLSYRRLPLPSKGEPGRPSTLPKRVARTENTLQSLLDEADRKRNAPDLTKAQRALALRARDEAVSKLNELESQAQAIKARGEGPTTLDMKLRRVTGSEVTFTLPADPDMIATIRKRIARKAPETFYSRPPGTAGAATQGMAPPGENYLGMIPGRVEGTTPETPIRREDVLKPLLKALGVPLYQGRMKGRKLLGFYRRGIEEVRIKRMSDIEVAAHELAHMLDDRFPEIRRQWNPATKANKEIRDELRGVSYDQSKLYEGFAEFVRLWSTQVDEARARAPKFFGWFEDWVAGSPHNKALRKAQADMHAWFAQDAVSRARSKIGVPTEINEALTGFWDRFRQSTSDDLHGIFAMEETLTGRIAPAGPYETARLTRAKFSIVEGALLYGAPVVNSDGSHSFKGKGLSAILEPVGEQLDDFLTYAVGRSAHELHGQGREHLFTVPEIKGMLALERPAFVKAFDEWLVWNNAIVDFAEAKGVINPMVRRMWKRAAYLPFNRVGQPGAYSAVPGDWKGVKALTGGTDNIRDVLGNMIGNTAMLINAGLENEARAKVAELATRPNGAHFMAKIPTEERTVRIHREEVRRAILEALGVRHMRQLPVDTQAMIDAMIGVLSPMVPLTMRGQTPSGKGVVAVLHDGQSSYYEVVDPVLYRSLLALNRTQVQNPVVRFLSSARRIGQLSVTLAMDFLARNFSRDTIMGSVMSRHGFVFLLDSIRGMKSRVTSDQTYRDAIANGVGLASYLVDEENFRAHIDRLQAFYTRKGIDAQTVLDTPKKMLFAVERIADAFEMATRLGEYRRAIEKGAHPRHAAYSGREVSTDFAMRGDSRALGFFLDTVLFLRAGISGLDRYYRGLVKDENRAGIAFRTGMLALLSIGLYLWNRDNPDYQDLEDWERDAYWHLYVPKPEALQAMAEGRPLPEDSQWHFRFPKTWEVGAIASVSERAVEGYLDGQPVEAAKHSARIMRDMFKLDVVSYLVQPPLEVALNRDLFTGAPIETEAMKDLQPWARSSPYGSRTVRALGEAGRNMPRELQVLSPAQIEHLLRGYFNAWANYGLATADAVFFDDVPDLRIEDYPVVGVFYRGDTLRGSKSVQDLYSFINEATEARRTLRLMDRTYRPQYADEIENTAANRRYQQANVARQRLTALRNEAAAVMWAQDLEQVRDLIRERARVTKRPGFLREAQRERWDDLGALKTMMRDDIQRERVRFARQLMREIDESDTVEGR